jgi:hypothetical protein
VIGGWGGREEETRRTGALMRPRIKTPSRVIGARDALSEGLQRNLRLVGRCKVLRLLVVILLSCECGWVGLR